MDEVISPTMTVKVAGHQWYWSYDNDSLIPCPGEDLESASLCNAAATINLIPLNEDLKETIRPLVPSDIPLIPSNNHKQTLDILNQALNSELFSSEVREFINQTRGVQYDSFCSITNNGDLVLPEGVSLGHLGPLPDLNRVSGIYMIVDNGTNDGYIGSSVDLPTRLRGHRDLGTSSSSLKSQHLLYSRVQEQGPDGFTFYHLQTGTNFVNGFAKSHPGFNITSKDLDLLNAFTKYELAVVEQAYLDNFKPSLNGRYIATTSTHPHLLTPASDMALVVEPVATEESVLAELTHEVDTTPKVDISNWKIYPNLKVYITDLDHNTLGSFKSLRSAAEALHTNHIKLSRYAKSISTVFIDYLGIEVNIDVDNVTKDGPVVHPNAKGHAALVHELQLPKGRITAITADLKAVFGDYPTVWAAAAVHFTSESSVIYRRISRYVGQSKLVKTDLGSFYFTADQETLDSMKDRKPIKSKPIIATDLSTGISKEFSSVTKVEK